MRFWIFILAIFLINFVSASCNETQIDINTASLKELDKIVHVGNATAWKIINLRPFNSVDELEEVSGISANYVLDIKNQGIACVNEVENQSSQNSQISNNQEISSDEENTETAESNITSKITSKSIDDSSNEKTPITSDTINLNPKDIKSESRGNYYAISGLIAFCFLLAFLFALKLKKNKSKENELV